MGLKKIMRVITSIHISDHLIIILLGVSFFLRWISWIALDRLLPLLLISHVTLEKSLQLYVFFFYTFIICEEEDIME